MGSDKHMNEPHICIYIHVDQQTDKLIKKRSYTSMYRMCICVYVLVRTYICIYTDLFTFAHR